MPSDQKGAEHAGSWEGLRNFGLNSPIPCHPEIQDLYV